MDMGFRSALSNYLASEGSASRGALAERISQAQGLADYTQAREGMMTATAGTNFARKIQEASLDTQSGAEFGGAGGVMVPKILQGASRGAKNVAGWANSRWRTAQAERFNAQEAGGTVKPTAPEGGELPEPGGEVELQPATSFKATGDEVPFPEVEPPKIDTSGISAEAKEAEQGAEGAVEDLAPELSAFGEGASAVGGALAGVAGLAGLGFGIYGLIEGIKGISEKSKLEGEDPYASVRGKITLAGKKISGLEANVSADQFEEKVGGARPAFGTLAVPTFDTAQQMGGGGHF